ncbi:proteobacterial dedicated sortase system response regulator [Marinobacter daepoensis]|uniref:Proteobacterial dedicated sortase system response regulator n=1 Tax=Marinobacter daepoensis TaxID=262077 RepID=A0ABS3BEA3_9GAMM|nr:proteobacterial dedicated sortase system response regulator [Marinobacter daepoensis]MBN7770163.1 proteobacterial dedicated sortase system response regulator [Marinobacter daepoensis]MBY6033693.1 proteobacterial dedicated sortase system response regulator [Marinobacter daepoensis]MBY6079609.1 proteobacterial dedicated sortase system response regulator [Marinobacter daepoensis]
MKKHIVLIEDEAGIRDNYRAAFERRGYRVSTYGDRPAAWQVLRQSLPDLAIIDVGLGDEPEGGFALCQDLRGLSATLPIIFLTARDSDIDSVHGLRLGADDYVTKDMSLDHLLARITALLRRAEAWAEALQKPDDILTRGRLRLNADRMTATWEEKPVDLTVTEFWMLHALVQHPGHVRSRDQLMEAASTILDDNTVTSHIKRIRRKFIQLDGQFDGIQTAYGMGYRWNAREV